LDDIGGAFGMGGVGGGLWHLMKGMKNSPGGSRFRGGIEVRILISWIAQIGSVIICSRDIWC